MIGLWVCVNGNDTLLVYSTSPFLHWSFNHLCANVTAKLRQVGNPPLDGNQQIRRYLWTLAIVFFLSISHFVNDVSQQERCRALHAASTYKHNHSL
jgi:hypothetical protein